MSAAKHVLWIALLVAAPAEAQQRVQRFDAGAATETGTPTDAVPLEAAWSPLDTHALTGLLIGGTTGALIGTMLTGFGCIMVEASGYDDCTASGVLLGTWYGGSIGGGIGLLIGLMIPRERAGGGAAGASRDES